MSDPKVNSASPNLDDAVLLPPPPPRCMCDNTSSYNKFDASTLEQLEGDQYVIDKDVVAQKVPYYLKEYLGNIIDKIKGPLKNIKLTIVKIAREIQINTSRCDEHYCGLTGCVKLNGGVEVIIEILIFSAGKKDEHLVEFRHISGSNIALFNYIQKQFFELWPLMYILSNENM